MKPIAAILSVAVMLAACTSLPSGDDPAGIEGMSPADVIAAMEAIELECSDPAKSGDAVYIYFSCVETPNVTSLEGASNTIDEMYFIDIHVGDGNPDTAERLAEAVLSIPYDGADPEAAMAWLSERLDSGACVQVAGQPDPTGCERVFGAAKLVLRVPSDETRIEISIKAVSTTPSPSPGESG